MKKPRTKIGIVELNTIEEAAQASLFFVELLKDCVLAQKTNRAIFIGKRQIDLMQRTFSWMQGTVDDVASVLSGIQARVDRGVEAAQAKSL